MMARSSSARQLVDRATITPDQLALIRDGRRERGTPPSRAWRLHQVIYQKHPGIRAIVNATPVNATAFSASATRLDTRTIPESYIFLRDVPSIRFPGCMKHRKRSPKRSPRSFPSP